MKLRNCCISLLLLAFTSLGWGQSPPCANNWCGPYSISLIQCLTGTGASGCYNSTSGPNNIGFYNTSKGTGLSSTSFEGILATQIPNNGSGNSLAGPHISPNGAVGSKQYLEFANRYVQAYDKTTDNPIFIPSPSHPVAQPQDANSPFNTPIGVNVCNPLTDDTNLVYDPFASAVTHGSNIWIIAGTATPASGSYIHTMCIAVSATDDQGNSGSAGTNYWSAYAYDLTPIIPSHTYMGATYYDLADYPRFGVWNDGYYLTFDFINTLPAGQSTAGQIEGSVACKLDKNDIELGNGSASTATCYTYKPASLPPMIHTLLPAHAETSSYPSGTQGEFFMATINPGTNGSPCVPGNMSNPQCHIGDLAYWTWSGIVAESIHTQLPVSTFVPGCYYNNGLATDTKCVPQPDSSYDLCNVNGSNVPCNADSLGDRLMSPLAYRYISPCDEDRVSYVSCEYLAVTQTIQEDPTWNSTTMEYNHRATAVRYYTFAAPVSPSTTPGPPIYQGSFADTSYSLYYWMPSNAIDEDENVGYTLSIGNGTTYPSPYMARIDLNNTQSTPAQTVSAGGADASDNTWGEYVSVSIDTDGLTFWGTGEYFDTNQTQCPGESGGSTTCTWQTQLFNCKEGVSGGFCP